MTTDIIRILFVFLLFICPFSAMSQDNAEIRRVKFEGNDAFSDGDLLDEISFEKSSWIKQTIFNHQPKFYSENAWEMNKAQLKAFYQSEGYLHVKIKEPELEMHPRKYKVDITITIQEGKPVIVNQVDFMTEKGGRKDSLLESDEWEKLQKDLEVEAGARFRDEEVKSDQDAIKSWFSSRGYAYVGAAPSITFTADTLGANLDWQIRKRSLVYFGEISIEGAKRTPESGIRRQFEIEEGELYSSNNLSRTQQQIYDLGLFRIASVQAPLTDRSRDTVSVNVSINEAPRLSTRVGVGYGREDQFRTFADMRYLNFPGSIQQTNLYAKHSGLEPYRFEVTVTHPAIIGPRSSLDFKPFIRTRDEPGFESLLWGGDLVLHQYFTNDLRGSATLYFERVDIDISSDFERSLDEMAISRYSKNGVSLGLFYNTANPRFDPTTGWSIAATTSGNSALFGSPYPFLKYLFEVKKFSAITNGLILALRLKMGGINPVAGAGSTPVEERFFAGGSQSLRGWLRQMLGPMDSDGIPIGGNSTIEGSIEPRIKIIHPVSMVVFMDYGNVWREENHYDFSDFRFAAGTGVRVSTPIGPVGIDFARPVFDTKTAWEFHLNIGHAF